MPGHIPADTRHSPCCDGIMNYLWQLRPYFRQTAGQLVLGSAAGIVMNTAVVRPAIRLGAAIDKALALARGEALSIEGLDRNVRKTFLPFVGILRFF